MEQPQIARINEIVHSFTYSDIDNLLSTPQLKYDPRNIPRILLFDFIPSNYLTRDKKGTCLKLTKRALEDIKKEFPGLGVRAVTGSESKYFSDGFHNYLIFKIDEEWVADPSLGLVAPLRDSGYIIRCDLTDFTQLDRRDLVLSNGMAIPLMINSRSQLVRLGARIDKTKLELLISSKSLGGREYLNFLCSKDLVTGKITSDKPQHLLEEKVVRLITTAEGSDLSRY